jgi:ATP-binding cassette, subfamily B, bacterial PglK
MLDTLKATAALLDPYERVHALLLAAAMLGSVVLEAVGVGLIFPLVRLLIAPDSLFESHFLTTVYHWSGVEEPRRFLAVCALAFLALIIFKSLYNALLTAYEEYLCHRISARMGALLLGRYLRAPWSSLLNRNSGDMIDVADVLSGWPLTNALRGYPVIATEGLLCVGILGILLYIAPSAALAAMAVFGAALFVSHHLVHRHLDALSHENARLGGERIQFLQQSLASIKEIKILGRESRFIAEYAEARKRAASVLTRLLIWQSVPRALVEPMAVGAMTVAIVAVSFSPATDLAGTTAILGLFSVAGIRLTPSLTRMLVAATSIRASNGPLARIQLDLAQTPDTEPRITGGPIPEMRATLCGKNLSYRYQTSTQPVLRELSFSLEKGTTIGLMGPSGSGKSTLADIIVGLLTPDSGTVLMDGVNIASDIQGWQRQIGYIPQTVSLIDTTLAENIALGMKPDEIDRERMLRVIDLARLDTLTSKLPEGLNTKIGERGIRLSGGERQRIGIARALYSGRTLLVMDEATSALDSETENEIGEAIARMRGAYTILIIAHRVSTMRRCDSVMILKEGRIVDQGPPEEIERRCAELAVPS